METERFRKFYQEQNVSVKFADLMDEIDLNQDGNLSYTEFVDYYTNVSPNFGSDKAFEDFVSCAWGLNWIKK